MPIPTHININYIEALKVFEYGLLIACPVNSNDSNPLSRPLHNVCLLLIAEKFKWMDKLSDAKCVQVYKGFSKCSLKTSCKQLLWGQ